MGKMLIFFGIVMGILILFHYTGLIEEGKGSVLLGYVLDPESIEDFDWIKTIKDNMLGIGTATVLIAAAIITGTVELALFAPMAILLWNIILDLLVVYDKIASIGTLGQPLAIIFLAVPIVSFIIVVVDWWRGRG